MILIARKNRLQFKIPIATNNPVSEYGLSGQGVGIGCCFSLVLQPDLLRRAIVLRYQPEWLPLYSSLSHRGAHARTLCAVTPSSTRCFNEQLRCTKGERLPCSLT